MLKNLHFMLYSNSVELLTLKETLTPYQFAKLSVDRAGLERCGESYLVHVLLGALLLVHTVHCVL